MTYTLSVPDEVVAVAREIAEATSQPLEDLLLNRLKTALPVPMLPAEEEAELEALHYLSDDLLWTIAREQMPADLQQRLEMLMDKNSLGAITSSEYIELEQLVDRGQRLMLRKSEAVAILTKRGYKVTPKDLAARE